MYRQSVVMAEGFSAEAPSGARYFTADTAAAEIPGLLGYGGAPPNGTVFVVASGPGGNRAVVVTPANNDHPNVREQTLTALALAQTHKLLLVGYGLGGDANALAIDDAIHTAPAGADAADRFWATQVLHTRAGRIREPGGAWRLQPPAPYLEGLSPIEKARLVRSIVSEAAELREQSMLEHLGGMSQPVRALKVVAQMVATDPVMRDVAIAELVGQEDGVANALALYGSAPGQTGSQPAMAGLVAAVAAANNPSSGLLRLTEQQGQSDQLWQQVSAHASYAARTGEPFALQQATLTTRARFTTDRTPGMHWPSVSPGWQEEAERSWGSPPMDRQTLESVAAALGHELTWEGDTAMTPTTRHPLNNGHYEAPEWGTWPLAVGTAEGLQTIVGDTVDTTPYLLKSGMNTDLDPIAQLELERQAKPNEMTIA